MTRAACLLLFLPLAGLSQDQASSPEETAAGEAKVSLTVLPDLPCKAEVWAMSGLAGLMAAAVGLAATAADGADRSAAEVS